MKNTKPIKVAVLALQGAFAEHEKVLKALGACVIELRQKADVEQDFDALVLPGGESTVQGKLLKEMDMFEGLREKIKEGMPVLATCAGLILLAEKVEEEERTYFETMPVTVKRNAYGRQLGSFSMKGEVKGIAQEYPMEFIRAPYITRFSDEVTVLAKDQKGNVVGAQYHNQLGFAFHPELTLNDKIHRYFLECVKSKKEL